MRYWELRNAVSLVDVLKVEVLGQVGKHELQVGFSEGLAHTDTCATGEWNKGSWVSLLTIGGLAKLVGVVESIRQEFCWTLPLAWIVVQTVEIGNKNVVFFKLVFPELQIFLDIHWSADLGWSLIA